MKRLDFRAIALALTGGAAAIGCTPLGTSGELGNGGFTYVCTADSDPTCDSTSFLGVTLVPDAIAVGATFSLDYGGEHPTTDDGTTYGVVVVPASPVMVDAETSGFHVKAPGEIAFLARGTNGKVADFLHVHAAMLDHFDVAGPSGESASALALRAGESKSLRATAADAGGRELGGALGYAWSSADPSIATVSVSLGDNDATVQAVAEGSTVVTVSVGDVRTDIPVTVEGSL